MFGGVGPRAAPAASQKGVVVKPGTAPNSIKLKEAAIVSLELYLASTQGTGGHNYPSDHEKLSGWGHCVQHGVLAGLRWVCVELL